MSDIELLEGPITVLQVIEQGPQGGEGPQGEQGNQGLQGNPGPVGYAPPAAWTTNTDYVATAPISTVTYNGDFYAAKVDHNSGLSFDPSKWTLLASHGDGIVGGVLAVHEIVPNGAQLASEKYVLAIVDPANARVAFGITPDGLTYLLREDEAHYPDGDIIADGLVWGIGDANTGRTALYVRRDGTTYLALSPRGLDRLAADFYPDPSTIVGVQNAFSARRVAPTAVGFLASLESPEDWGGTLPGDEAGTRVTLPYRQRTDIASPTAVRDAQGPVLYMSSTGDSSSNGSMGQTGGKVVTDYTPTIARYNVFGFPPDTNPLLGQGARGAGNNLLSGAQLTSIIPLEEHDNTAQGGQGGETGWLNGLTWYCWTRDKLGLPWQTVMGRSHGASGKSTGEVSEGQRPFENGAKEIAAAVSVLSKYGRTVEAPWVIAHMCGHDRERTAITTTSDTTSGATIDVSTTALVHIGGEVVGHANIPPDTYVVSYVIGGTQITLSNPVTGTVPSGTAITVRPYLTGLPGFWDALHTSYADRWGSVTGQDVPPILAFCQICAPCQGLVPSPAEGVHDTPETVQVVLDYVRANPDISRLVWPRYAMQLDPTDIPIIGHSNPFHYDAISYALEYEYAMKAYLVEEQSGARWTAFGEHMTVTRVGTTVQVRIWRDAAHTIPWTGCSFDTTTFAATALATCEAVPDGNKGWRYMVGGSGGTNICTGVAAVSGGYDLTISSAVGGQYDYAYIGPGSINHSGAWGNCFDGGDTINGVLLTSRIFPGLVLKNPLVICKGQVA
jgi:hypothetical protein